MWTGTLASQSLQAAVLLNNLVTADCGDSSGLLLRLPLSDAGWALLWYFTLRAWLNTPAGSLTVLYRYTLCTVGCQAHTYTLGGKCVSVGHFLSFMYKCKMTSEQLIFKNIFFFSSAVGSCSSHFYKMVEAKELRFSFVSLALNTLTERKDVREGRLIS